jgi:hypothetical protein
MRMHPGYPPAFPPPPNLATGPGPANVPKVPVEGNEVGKGNGGKVGEVATEGATQSGKAKRKRGNGKKKKNSENSDEEVDEVLSKAEQKEVELQVPPKPQPKEDKEGTHWTEEETLALVDFMMDPERVSDIQVDATKFFKDVSA